MKEITLSMFCLQNSKKGYRIFFRHNDGTEINYTNDYMSKDSWTIEGVRQPENTAAQMDLLIPDIALNVTANSFGLYLRELNPLRYPYVVIYIIVKMFRMGFYIVTFEVGSGFPTYPMIHSSI